MIYCALIRFKMEVKLSLMLLFIGLSSIQNVSRAHVIFNFFRDLQSPMSVMLDAMQELMTGEGTFNRRLYREQRSCMRTFSSRLPETQDMAWRGIVDYWRMGGTLDDPWGGRSTGLIERNITEMTLHNMQIYEPCNFVSNLVYYHVMTEICHRQSKGEGFSMASNYIKAVGQSVPTLTSGSCFYHGSNTRLGFQQDYTAIQMVSYLIHQGSLSGLTNPSPILTDLTEKRRDQSSLQLTNTIQNMYRTKFVGDWYEITENLDIPDYYLIFGALLSTVMTLNLKPELVDYILPRASGAFGLTKPQLKFLQEHYLVELRKVTANLDLDKAKRKELFGNSLGTILKLAMAYIWREKNEFSNPVVFSPQGNMLGWLKFAHTNRKINKIKSQQYLNMNLQDGRDIYPGDSRCNSKYPHPKWHIESALFMLDLIYLGDDIHKIFSVL